MGIPNPDYHLGIGSASHGAQTGRMLEAIEQVLLKEHPDWVLVYGDTNSTLAGALAAVKLHIPVAHVEAGLRSFNRRMPEEINRILTDHASTLLFTPTSTGSENLRNEGVPAEKIVQVGDVMYDASLYYGQRAQEKSQILNMLGLKAGQYILATIHRAENTDDPQRLEAICKGLHQAAEGLSVVLPLHPRTRHILQQHPALADSLSSFQVIDPVGYLDMVMLEKNARLIATDSGGLQKEAFFQAVPCATLRNESEWVELVQLGWVRLVPPNSISAVTDGMRWLLNQNKPPMPEDNPYGQGDASEKIAQTILHSSSMLEQPPLIHG
jgi:UDP-GlcNAc3NAcA epimerase